MKRVKNLIKLTNLNLESLDEKEQNLIVVANDGPCGCYYSECGGSSYLDNLDANEANNKESGDAPWGQAEWNGAGL